MLIKSAGASRSITNRNGSIPFLEIKQLLNPLFSNHLIILREADRMYSELFPMSTNTLETYSFSLFGKLSSSIILWSTSKIYLPAILIRLANK